ncbi:MAG: hypothetical protein KGL39_59390, partial [Patescibacteria group bacterium]|nr:hypothetical protein [Patescibacteria group bacterium]
MATPAPPFPTAEAIVTEATGSAVVGNSAWQDTGTVSTYGGNYIKVGSASNVFYAGATDSTSAACT